MDGQDKKPGFDYYGCTVVAGLFLLLMALAAMVR